MNRLANVTSPYLLQHADNPVDWYPWGEEAFAEARRRDVPVLISVGYASCHWCHVMAHESFEDPDTARLVNETLVAVKVDREERPDVDAVYMAATQATTGHGGWPMTVFATPDGEPFFCGTYFPKAVFDRLVGSVGTAWRDQRVEVMRQGAAVVEAVADLNRRQPRRGPAAGGVIDGAAPADTPLDVEVLDAAVARLARGYDQIHGGFGGAPKFPPAMVALFLLRHHQRTGDASSLEIVRHTAEAMARGGIYDQLAGGFSRYSVDERWQVPHFEKMLYDNALLLRVYTQLWRLTGDPMPLRIATETARFLVRDLRRPTGGLASSLDADTPEGEGMTYVWSVAEMRAVLGDSDGAHAVDLFGVTEAGTFEPGRSVLVLRRDVDDPQAGEAPRRDWTRWREALLAARAHRPQPNLDDKVVSAWNGLAVTALAEYEALVADPEVAGTSLDVARYLEDRHVYRETGTDRGGTRIRLRRASRDRVAGEPTGVLEDYGCVAEAFCAVHQLTGDGRWLTLAGGLLDAALELFDDGAGGWYDTAADAERLVVRPADPSDNASPSGLSALAAALVTYTALTGRTHYADAARTALAGVAALVVEHPRYAGYAAAVGEALISGPYQIAIASDDPDGPLVRVARRHAPPGAVVVAGASDAPGVPLLADRPMRDGQATGYVCRGFVCDRPVTTAEELRALLMP
jgi:uncharacterized protein YyaL (SSP411 family)